MRRALASVCGAAPSSEERNKPNPRQAGGGQKVDRIASGSASSARRAAADPHPGGGASREIASSIVLLLGIVPCRDRAGKTILRFGCGAAPAPPLDSQPPASVTEKE